MRRFRHACVKWRLQNIPGKVQQQRKYRDVCFGGFGEYNSASLALFPAKPLIRLSLRLHAGRYNHPYISDRTFNERTPRISTGGGVLAAQAMGADFAYIGSAFIATDDPSKMNFGGDKSKAWKDIWGCGQGIGAITRVQSAAGYIAQLRREYQEARQRLLG